MILTLKNRQLLGMSTLLKEAANKGGVPNHFLLSRDEFREVLNEIKEIPEEQNFIQMESGSSSPEFFKYAGKIKSGEPYDEQELSEFVDEWARQTICLTYKKVKIKPKDSFFQDRYKQKQPN